jgi:hypothetical protein
MAHPSTPQPMRANPLAAPHQLRIAFDCVDLRGMTPTDRANVLTKLATLLLQAAGVQTEEAIDDRR